MFFLLSTSMQKKFLFFCIDANDTIHFQGWSMQFVQHEVSWYWRQKQSHKITAGFYILWNYGARSPLYAVEYFSHHATKVYTNYLQKRFVHEYLFICMDSFMKMMTFIFYGLLHYVYVPSLDNQQSSCYKINGPSMLAVAGKSWKAGRAFI